MFTVTLLSLLAVGDEQQQNLKQLWSSAISFWGWTAWISWAASAILWMLVVSKHPLLEASSISSVRYVLICLAVWLVWRDAISWREVFGIFFIALGIVLVAR
ncbi:hypothetical protein LAY57_35695 [Argonema antarcticum A004/B2]|nr:hypothetical protein [Argonema antarcticum A004/B2]